MKTDSRCHIKLLAIPLFFLVGCMNRGFQVLPMTPMTETQVEQQVQSEKPAPNENPVENEDPVKKEAPVKKEDPVNEGASVNNENLVREEPSQTSLSQDFMGPGVLKPTIYYFPKFNEDESKCDRNTMMHGAGGKDLLLVCAKTAQECGQQGSCEIVQKGISKSFNVLNAQNGQDRFFEIKDDCIYGYGVDGACLDPYYTLAADMELYKPGQVIFVPAVVGLKLPDGSKHSGYFVVRDKGRGVNGVGRFDFFSGVTPWRSSENPFTKLGLGDTKTNIPYYKVKGKTAQQVLQHRAFPKLPRQ